MTEQFKIVSKPKIVLIGGGGHCKSCIDVIEEEGKFEIAGIVDIPEKKGDTILGYRVIANDNDIPSLVNDYSCFLITIGQLKSPARRIEIFEILLKLKVSLPVIISPFAHVSRHASLGNGTIVMHGAIINAQASVGKNGIVNSNALIEHDAEIGEHCHISTGAIVNGGVIINQATLIGSGAVIKQGISIGEHCIVAMGRSIKTELRTIKL
jgi:sugar O-acyltransferase (sialic acid O-acetyltransferase NeuD family)